MKEEEKLQNQPTFLHEEILYTIVRLFYLATCNVIQLYEKLSCTATLFIFHPRICSLLNDNKVLSINKTLCSSLLAILSTDPIIHQTPPVQFALLRECESSSMFSSAFD